MGVPIPGETALVIGAALAGQGRLTAWGVALAGWSGAVVGDNIGYWVFRRWSARILAWPGVRRVYDARRLAAGERFFERWGVLAVFFGRFIAILRIFAGPLAGMNRMHWPRFLLANAGGGAVWVAVITTVGLLLSDSLDNAVTLVSRLGYAGLALAAIILVTAGVMYRRRRSRRELEEGERLLAHQKGERG
jgi:membrane protein DedA with SNARE-associated domain